MLVTILCLTLTGCGGVKQNDVNALISYKWNNGAMNFGGKDVPGLTAYYGSTCEFSDVNGNWQARLEYAQDLTFNSTNSQGIEQMNMSTKGDITYYTEYLDSQFTGCYSPTKDEWYIGMVMSNGLNLDVAIMTAQTVFDNIAMTYGCTTCTMNDTIKVGDGNTVVYGTSDSVGITGLLKVTVGSHPLCTSPYTFIDGNKEYSMMKGSADGYDVYQYGEYLIQTLSGYPIEDYIDILK